MLFQGGGHWGGYAFRLCKVKDFSTGMTNDVSEECFQKTHLKFQQKAQWILGLVKNLIRVFFACTPFHTITGVYARYKMDLN